MPETVFSFLSTIQPLFCPASLLWLILSKHIPHKTKDEHLYQLTHSILPGVLLHYLGIALIIFLSRYDPNRSSKAYYILLCLDTFLLFDVISTIIQRYKSKNESDDSESVHNAPGSNDDDRDFF